MATLSEACKRAVALLEPKYGQGEARAMVRIALEELKGWTPTDQVIRACEDISPFLEQQLTATVNRLMHDEPIQYIFGHARFYGMNFKVTPVTLIPRPETEGLVQLVVDDAGNRKDLRVIDLGTGTGCIAIALARQLKFAEVTAVDYSPKVLDVARENAVSLHANVQFLQADINDINSLPDGPFDIIVSNPPYIAEDEKEQMEANVLLFEPRSALFVPVDEPLKFYVSLLAFAIFSLKPGGAMYWEINPRYAEPLKAVVKQLPFEEVRLHRDIEGRWRYLSCRRPK